VEDAVEAAEVEVVLGQVDPANLDPARVLLLQRGVVVVREAVDPDDLVAPLEELLGQLRPDESGRAGDDVPHRREPNGVEGRGGEC